MSDLLILFDRRNKDRIKSSSWITKFAATETKSLTLSLKSVTLPNAETNPFASNIA
ncbi:hypothetical protein ACHAXM_004486 [Skeletonema potamos]